MRHIRLCAVVALLWVFLSGCAVPQRAELPRQEGFEYFNAADAPFAIGGIAHPLHNGGAYYRLNYADQEAYSEAVKRFAHHTAGGTVRFRTDAEAFSLRVQLHDSVTNMQHMSDRGAFGWDAYAGDGIQREYCGEPLQLMTDAAGFCETISLPAGDKEVLIHLPSYGGVSSLEIGLPDGASLVPAAARAHGTIAFYGSSITQGACVSRPGLSYASIVCRSLDADCMNLGFSGSALGEQEIAQYIASQNISALVMEYDHNHTVQGLAQTHYPFYETVRAAHPDIPILMLSQPVFTREPTAEQLQRQDIIRQSYDRARASGDENVYFLCGGELFDIPMPDLCTADMLHPNDLGHYHMAQAILRMLQPTLCKP